MALFRSSDPQKAIDAAIANRDRLHAKLAESDATVIRCKMAAKVFALDASADDTALDKADGATRSAQDRVATIAGAIIEAEEQLAALEAARDEADDKRQRAATIAEIEGLTKALDAVAREFDPVITKMATLAESFGLFVPEAQGLLNFTTAARTQIPDCVAMIKMLAANHAAAVLAGTAPAALRKPQAAFVPTIAAKPATVALFAMRPIKWRDASGHQIVAQKFTDVNLTPTAAIRALDLKAAVQMNDPLRKANHGTAAGHARADIALDLDADPDRAPQTEPIQHSAFQPVKVGAPYTLKIAREG
jgi:hypothetical protein